MYGRLKFKEGIMSEKDFLPKWLEENQYKVNKDYVVTPQMAHYATIIRQVHQNSERAILLEGKPCTGKTNLLNFYRQTHYSSSYYAHIHVSQGPFWIDKLLSPLEKHSLEHVGAKINYEWGVIIVDDLHMAQK